MVCLEFPPEKPNISFRKPILSFETRLIPFGEPLEEQMIPDMPIDDLKSGKQDTIADKTANIIAQYL